MVQSTPGITPSGWPASGAGPVPVTRVNISNYKEFKALLARDAKPAEPPEGDGRRGPVGHEMATGTPREILRSQLAEPPDKELAPEERPGHGQGAGDVAELLSLLNPPVGVSTPPAALAEPSLASPAGAAQVAELVERWVRRVSLGGDQRRGVARLDIAEGRYAGAELLVSAEAGHVSVELTLPSGPADARLSERLRARLEGRGLSADVTVR